MPLTRAKLKETRSYMINTGRAALYIYFGDCTSRFLYFNILYWGVFLFLFLS